MLAGAQTTSGGQGSRSTAQVSSGGKSTKKGKSVATKRNDRVMYRSKKTGQSATPTGQEATGTNGSHSNNPKNAGKSEE